MKIAYIGAPQLSAGLLKKLIDNKEKLGIDIEIVITQPEMPVGRKQIMTPTPVKELALQNNLPISHDIHVLNEKNVELAVLFAFGQIIPQKILDIPTHGFWNIHPSLLPAYRGASPITFPIFLGETSSGITLMQMDADLDHGPIIDQVPIEIPPTTYREDIEKQVIEKSYEMASKKISELNKKNIVNVVQQDHTQATFTRPLTKANGYLEKGIVLKAIKGESISSSELPQLLKSYYALNKLDLPHKTHSAATVVWNLYRSLHGWPGIWTQIDINGIQKRLKIVDLILEESVCKVLQVQIEGKTAVDFKTFSQVYSLN
jgi:methionyl-tRNA formyltransferase